MDDKLVADLLRPLGELLRKEMGYQAKLIQCLEKGEPYSWVGQDGERRELTDHREIRAWKNVKFHQAKVLRHALRLMGERVPEARPIVQQMLAQADSLIAATKRSRVAPRS